MGGDWFCEIAGREVGPLTSQQLKTMAVKGQILPSDCVRHGAEGNWVPAGQVKGLFGPAGPVLSARPIVLPKPPPIPPPLADVAEPSGVDLPPAGPGAVPFDVTDEPEPPATPTTHGPTKNRGRMAIAKRKQQQQQLLIGAMIALVVGLTITGLILALNGVRDVGEVGGGGMTDLSKRLEKAAAAKPANKNGNEFDAASRPDAGKLKKPKDDGKAKPDRTKPKPKDAAKPDETHPAAAEPPAEKPEEKADDGKWVDASMSPALVGEVPVRVQSAAWESGKGAGGTDRLLIALDVKNPSRIYKLSFAGWSPEAARRGVSLTDDQGKTCAVQEVNTAELLTKTLPTTIKPRESAKDVLAFDVPNTKVKYLKLELSATPVDDKPGTLNLKIPRKMITGAPDSSQAAPEKPAATPEPIKVNVKPVEPRKPKAGTPEDDFGINPDDAPKD